MSLFELGRRLPGLLFEDPVERGFGIESAIHRESQNRVGSIVGIDEFLLQHFYPIAIDKLIKWFPESSIDHMGQAMGAHAHQFRNLADPQLRFRIKLLRFEELLQAHKYCLNFTVFLFCGSFLRLGTPFHFGFLFHRCLLHNSIQFPGKLREAILLDAVVTQVKHNQHITHIEHQVDIFNGSDPPKIVNEEADEAEAVQEDTDGRIVLQPLHPQRFDEGKVRLEAFLIAVDVPEQPRQRDQCENLVAFEEEMVDERGVFVEFLKVLGRIVVEQDNIEEQKDRKSDGKQVKPDPGPFPAVVFVDEQHGIGQENGQQPKRCEVVEDIIGRVQSGVFNPEVGGQHISDDQIGDQKHVVSGPFPLFEEDGQGEKANGADPDGE